MHEEIRVSPVGGAGGERVGYPLSLLFVPAEEKDEQVVVLDRRRFTAHRERRRGAHVSRGVEGCRGAGARGGIGIEIDGQPGAPHRVERGARAQRWQVGERGGWLRRDPGGLEPLRHAAVRPVAGRGAGRFSTGRFRRLIPRRSGNDGRVRGWRAVPAATGVRDEEGRTDPQRPLPPADRGYVHFMRSRSAVTCAVW